MTNKQIISISIVIFTASLAMPSYIHGVDASFPGIFCLLFGPVGLFFLHFTWLANPFLLISWITAFKKNYSTSITTAIVAFIIALTFPLYKDLPQGSSGMFPFKIQYGYYIWVISIGSMIVINLYFLLTQSEKNKSEKTILTEQKEALKPEYNNNKNIEEIPINIKVTNHNHGKNEILTKSKSSSKRVIYILLGISLLLIILYSIKSHKTKNIKVIVDCNKEFIVTKGFSSNTLYYGNKIEVSLSENNYRLLGYLQGNTIYLTNKYIDTQEITKCLATSKKFHLILSQEL